MNGYIMYLCGVQMPITPGKLQTKIKGKNKTLTLVNDGEINFLRLPGLTEIQVEVLLPMLQVYPFSNGSNYAPDYYLGLFEQYVAYDPPKPTQLILSRASPGGRRLYDTSIKVSIESYDILESVENGADIKVSLSLKLYKDFATKTVTIIPAPAGSTAPPTAVIEKARETSSAPQTKAYTVVKGDCLYLIAKKYYGDGGQWQKIFDANKDKISNPNLIYPGQEITIP